MISLERLELQALIGSGAIAAGVHAGLAPPHVHEWAPLGASLLAVAMMLSATVAGVALRPQDRRLGTVLACLLGAVPAAYLVTRLVAVPPLDPEREAFDALGIGTSVVEMLGLLLAVHIYRPRAVFARDHRR